MNFELKFWLWLAVSFLPGGLAVVSFLFFRARQKAAEEVPIEPEVSASLVKRKTSNRFWLIITLAGGVFFGIGLTGLWTNLKDWPRVIGTSLGAEKILRSYPLEVEFNVPVDIRRLVINIAPETEGEWVFERYLGFLPWARKASFRPEYSFPPGQKGMLYFSALTNPFHQEEGNESLVDFVALPLPSVVSAVPAQEGTEVLPETEVHFFLDLESDARVIWEAKFEPLSGAPEVKLRGPRELVVIPPAALSQDMAYRVDLFRTPAVSQLSSGRVEKAGETELAFQLHFRTVRPPLITSFLPEGNGVKTTTPITVIFDEPMQPATVEEAIRIEPNVSGYFSWNRESTQLNFVPEGWEKETSYRAIFSPGYKDQRGAVAENEAVFAFRTIGPVEISSFSPVEGAVEVGLTEPVVLRFDQEVDRQSVQEAFQLTPAVAGRYEWEGNTFLFFPEPGYTFQTQYHWSLSEGVTSLFGLASRRQFAGRFTTVPDRFLLEVPLIYQDDPYACNIAAARMLLAYRGVTVSEMEFRSAVGTAGKRGSGNPHLGLVENYGTYWEPISRVASQYRPVRVYTNWNLQELLTEVRKGNPVQVWAQNKWSTPTNISWTAGDGTFIYAVSGMHSVVVRGFVGTPEVPIQVIFNDPWRPWRGVRTVAAEKFAQSWSYFRVGMVVD